MIYLRAFTYGFVFFGIVAFIAFGGPPINQWVLKATIGNGLIGGIGCACSYLAAKIIFDYYKDLIGNSND